MQNNVAFLSSKNLPYYIYFVFLITGSPYTTPFSSVILRLQEDGFLHDLKERWWAKEGGGKECPPEEKSVGKITNELSLVNVGGIFLVLLAGTGSACVLVVIEFIIKTRNRRVSMLIFFFSKNTFNFFSSKLSKKLETFLKAPKKTNIFYIFFIYGMSFLLQKYNFF